VTKFPQHFYRLAVLSLTQPTASKHRRKQYFLPVRTANKRDNYCVADRLTVSSYVCVYVDVVEGRGAHSTAENWRLRTTTCRHTTTSGLSTLFQTNVTFLFFWNNSVLRHRCPYDLTNSIPRKCATIFLSTVPRLKTVHYLVEFAKFISSVYNSTTMTEVSLPADTLITFMPQICRVSIGVWYTRSCVTPQMRYRSFRIRVFPVNHLHWHYWQPNICQLFSDCASHTSKVFSCDQSRHPLLDHWETAFTKC